MRPSLSSSSLPADLNDRQREAICYLDGPCLVLAGAGSGKTRVITQKIAWLLRECGYAGRHVMALTFTNKAAREMASRVRGLVDSRQAQALSISTFHSLGLRLLREEAAQVGLKQGFSVLDGNDSLAIVQDLLATTDKARLRSTQQTLSLWKNRLLTPDQAVSLAATPQEQDAARIYHSYAATLKAYQAVDFDDLIRLPTELLLSNATVRERWQARVHYLLVDEYQDTNPCQYQFVQALTGQRAMFTAVGDDDQAIYAWRGATVENLMRLTDDYPGIKVIKLEQNYRSTQRILTAANQVIAQNTKVFDKRLWSDLGVGESIQVTPMASDSAEAESIAMRLSAARFDRQAQWRDFAVLYRSNHQARILEQALRSLRIPYVVSGGQSFFDRAEIRDVLAYLRLLVNDADDSAFIRAVTTPPRGVGQTSLKLLGEYASEQGLSLFEAAFHIQDTGLLAARAQRALTGFIHWMTRLQERAHGAPSPLASLAGHGVQSSLALPDAVSSGAMSEPNEYTVGVDGAVDDSPARILNDLLADIRYEDWLFDTLDDRPARKRWQHVQELVDWLRQKASSDAMTLPELAQHIALVTMLERQDEEDPDAVRLSTLHASKGLEYPHVYLIGVEEGMLPHAGQGQDDTDTELGSEEGECQRIQEERRLMYVGITRAQRSLHISWCERRRRGREEVSCEPSRFIAEMALADNAPQDIDEYAGLSPRDRLAKLRGLLEGH